MLDSVPTQVWLLLLIALTAIGPSIYVYRYIGSSAPDPAQPSADLEWRSSTTFTRCVVVLFGLAALGVFIFTPAATAFAQSPSFWPIFSGVIGLLAIYEAILGWTTGSVKPMIRGSLGPFSRSDEPIRYWLSMSWNAGIGVFLLYCSATGRVQL